MATTWKAPTWRMPNDKNQNKFENYSLNFDGTNSNYITCGNNSSLSGPYTDYTISSWIKTPSSWENDYNAIFSKKYSFYFGLNTSHLLLLNPGTGANWGTERISNYTFELDKWYHVAATADGTNVKLYINGELDYTIVDTNTAQNSNTSHTPYLGAYDNAGDYDTWKGDLNDIIFFDYALSESQISSLYNSGSPINPMTLKPAPIANYLLGGNASTGGDSTNTLSVPNVAVPDASVFDFDGTNDFVESSSPLNLTNKSFSLETWIKWDGAASRRVFFGHAEANATKKNIHWRIYSNGMLRFDFYNSSIDSSVGAIEANTWHHLSITYDYDTSTCICYKNGQELMQGTIGPYIGSVSNSSTFLGCMNNGAELFPGEMFLFRQYDVVLTPSEVTTLYNSGVPLTETIPQASSLRAWYKLDQSANWEADTAGKWQIPDAVSSYPQSFNFIDGNDTFIDFGANENILDFSGNDYTVSAWVNWDGTGDTNQMIASVKLSLIHI